MRLLKIFINFLRRRHFLSPQIINCEEKQESNHAEKQECEAPEHLITIISTRIINREEGRMDPFWAMKTRDRARRPGDTTKLKMDFAARRNGMVGEDGKLGDYWCGNGGKRSAELENFGKGMKEFGSRMEKRGP